MNESNANDRSDAAALDDLLARLFRHDPVIARFRRAVHRLRPEDSALLMRLMTPVMRGACTEWIEEVVRKAVEQEMMLYLQRSAEPPTLLDVDGVARWLHVSTRTVERLVAGQELIPIWIGSTRRFSRESIEGFLRRSTRGRERPHRRRGA